MANIAPGILIEVMVDLAVEVGYLWILFDLAFIIAMIWGLWVGWIGWVVLVVVVIVEVILGKLRWRVLFIIIILEVLLLLDDCVGFKTLLGYMEA